MTERKAMKSAGPWDDEPVRRVRAGACSPLEPLTARDAAERAGLLPRPRLAPLRARQEGKSYVPSLPDPVRPQFVWAFYLALAIGAAVFLFRL